MFVSRFRHRYSEYCSVNISRHSDSAIQHICFTLIFVAAACSTALPAHAEKHVAIAGTRVSLVMPENFEVSADFAGIIWRDASASIHVTELPAPAAQMQASLTQTQLASRGMALLQSEQVQSSIGPALFLHVSQMAQGAEFHKWMLVAGTAKETVLLTATAPKTLAAELRAPLRQCLLSALWDPSRAADPRLGVAFTVIETDDLKVAKSITGSALLLTQGGVQSTGSAADPFMVVSRSTAEVAIEDLGVFSRRRLGETNKISNADVQFEQELVVGGMPAHELIALATAENSVAVVVHQVIAFDGNHYFVTHGRVGVDQQKRYLDQFREIARSLSYK